MGTILSSKIYANSLIKLKICLDEEEALSLKGCVRNIHIFTSNLCTIEGKVIQRGRGGTTKHFLIPVKIRNKTKKMEFEVKCQRVETKNQAMFVYTINHEKSTF